ncbi:uncharacterized protein PG986_000033 [Apiospora aurea]|uniref:Ankyrin n=1 Tax=Apiospora aurea TaxID=335848 RepID=A0ABR1QSV8_9PEZI
MALGFPIKSDDGDSALHYVKETTPAECINVLKEHLPNYCDKRTDGILPVEVYIRGWLSTLATGIDQQPSADIQDRRCKAIEQLTSPSTLTSRDEIGLSVWNYAVTCVRLVKSFRSKSRFVICTCLGSVLRLGYMRSHEQSTGESGLMPLLEILDLSARKSYQSWPVGPEFLMHVADETDYWSLFCQSSIALELLHSSCYPDTEMTLVRFLSERGVFPGDREPCAALRYIELPYIYNINRTCQEAANLILDCLPEDSWNKIDPTEQESGLIRCTCSTWLAEELIRRGADPNLRTNPCYDNTPALVHHILERQTDVALCLLKNGARADEADARGVNAMHAAVITGNIGILESILPILSLSEHPSWFSWCTWACYGETGTADLLHLSALEGQLDCMKFLFQHDKAQKFIDETDRAWRAMHFAAFGGYMSIIRYMHQHGFDTNIRHQHDGYTPLHCAVEHQRASAVEQLIELGAESLEDRQGKTPWTWQCSWDFLTSLKYSIGVWPKSMADQIKALPSHPLRHPRIIDF